MHALCIAARHGLASAPAHVVGDDEGRSLLAKAAQHRLVGLLDQAVADGAVIVPPDLADTLTAKAVEVAGWSLLVEREHVVVAEVLEAGDVEHRFLKGPTVAHRHYPHPGLRTFVDVDVLVRSHDLDRAVELLEAAGIRRNRPELVAGFSARYGKSVTMTATGAVEVDVHRLLASGPFGAASIEPLWNRPAAQVPVGTTALTALDGPGTLVHACVHAVTGRSVRLGSLRDVAQIAADGVDGDEVAALAQDLGVQACITRAAQLVERELAVPLPPTLHAALGWPMSTREQRWLELHASPHRYGDLARESLRATPGAWQKLAYAVSLGRAWRARRARP